MGEKGLNWFLLTRLVKGQQSQWKRVLGPMKKIRKKAEKLSKDASENWFSSISYLLCLAFVQYQAEKVPKYRPCKRGER
jgi:hypothetical protein